MLEELRERVCNVARRMAADGMVKLSAGNVSAIDRETRCIAVTPSAVPYETMAPEDIVIVDMDGKVLEGLWHPSTELPMHLSLYRAISEGIGAVVHTHSVYAAALSTVVDEVPPILAETVISVGGSIRVAPYRRTGTQDLGEAVASALDGRRAVLLQNHGLVAVGEEVEKAYGVSVLAEEACQVYYIARTLGMPKVLPPEEVEFLRSLKYGARPL